MKMTARELQIAIDSAAKTAQEADGNVQKVAAKPEPSLNTLPVIGKHVIIEMEGTTSCIFPNGC